MKTTQGLPTATPEEVGLSSTRLERINKVMQSYVDQNKLAGLITMVARRGKVAYLERFGKMDIEANKPMQFDTIFQIASMTKPITSVAVIMLYEEGYFQLTDPVSNYIPEFKDIKVFVKATEGGIKLSDQEREVTIRDLLTHTSGLAYGDFLGDSPVATMYKEADLFRTDRTLKEMIQELGKLPLLNQPGSQWRYGVSYDVLGYLVEVVSGMPFDRFLEQKIFNPLGMEDTGFYVPKEKIDRFGSVYGPTEEGSLEVIDAPATSQFSKSQNLLLGGGGLVSTATDYMRFAQMLLNGGELDGTRILSRKTIELMTTNHLPEELIPLSLGVKEMDYIIKGFGYGLGFGVLIDVAQSEILGSEGEFQWGGAANTFFLVDPKENLIGLIMTQFRPFYYYPIEREFRVLTYQAIID